jgi:predicted nucleotidyltransferase
MQEAVTDALRPLPAAYTDLFGRVLRAAESDDRVRAVWLGGSVGRGIADAGSDLDVVLAIAPEVFDEFTRAWREWLGRVTPVVLARELPRLPGSFYSVTPDCLRLDVVAEPAGASRPADLARRLLVLHKDSAPTAPEPMAEPAAAGPNPARLTEMADEFLRQMTIFPAAVVARRDWLLGVIGVQNVHLMLYQLFVEANQPLPPMGVKQWSAKLTSRQRQVCASLPAPTASAGGVLMPMRACAAAFRREAIAILAASDAPWPADFDDAVRRYWQHELGWAE